MFFLICSFIDRNIADYQPDALYIFYHTILVSVVHLNVNQPLIFNGKFLDWFVNYFGVFKPRGSKMVMPYPTSSTRCKTLIY